VRERNEKREKRNEKREMRKERGLRIRIGLGRQKVGEGRLLARVSMTVMAG
jgi:hypothetical protein